MCIYFGVFEVSSRIFGDFPKDVGDTQMSLKDLWRLDWRAGSRHVVVLVDVVKDVRKRGTVALT